LFTIVLDLFDKRTAKFAITDQALGPKDQYHQQDHREPNLLSTLRSVNLQIADIYPALKSTKQLANSRDDQRTDYRASQAAHPADDQHRQR
jgi:hypothetical protein